MNIIKDIQYKGYTASPSDYECSDGELAMSLNLIHEDGSLRPVMQPKEVMDTPNADVRCVHETATHVNYIVITRSNDLEWIDSANSNANYTSIYSFQNIDVYGIIPIGNTLVVSTSDGIYYFLWKENGYLSLGNMLPELAVTPYISTKLMNTDSFKDFFKLEFDNPELSEKITGTGGNLDDILYPNLCDNLLDGSIDQIGLNNKLQQNIYEKVFAAINPRSKTLKEKGYFFEPFYVRFAYRLYDGSHIRHTVPVLIVPMTWGKPLFSVIINKGTGSNNESTTKALFEPIYFAGNLFANIIVSDTITNWKDIITDIDIFVTEPLIDYTDSAQSLVSIRKLSYDDGNEIKPRVMTIDDSGTSVWKGVSELSSESDEFKKEFYVKKWFRKQSDGTAKTETRFFFQGYENSVDCYVAFDCRTYNVSSDVLNPHTLDGYNNTTGGNIVIYSISEYLALNDTDAAYAFKIEQTVTDDVEIDTYIITKGALGSISGEFYIETKRTDGQSYENILTRCDSFYKISELSISELSNNGWNGPISIIDGTLNNLTTRQTLSDLGQGHNKIVASDIFSYNSRLNAIVKEVQFLNPSVNLKMQNCKKIDNNSRIIEKAYVEIYENSQTSYIEIPLGGSVDLEDLFYFTYPSSNAKNLYVEYEYGNNKYHAVIALKPHDFINQAYAFNMFEMLECEKKGGLLNVTINEPIRYGNIIRLSDVNNPFRFSEEYTVSLPVDEVYALSTAAKALSQGQFGQYPLYAFTSDGIWALEITSTGTYSARQPISRDVVVNKKSISQIDSSVLFATDRGIMLISGSQVICISDSISSAGQFSLNELPKSDILTAIFDDTLNTTDICFEPFSDFVADCRMIYDYTHQHIIVCNPGKRYAYVYSLKSQLWGMMLCNIKDNVKSYPEALAMTNDNKLVDFSKEGISSIGAMIITRPVSMGQPDIHKTISAVIQRGCIKNDKMKQVLYGSNDLNNWFIVWSSDNRQMGGFSGSPWKYYRIVMIREFDKAESLYGFSLQYEPRMTNRLR